MHSVSTRGVRSKIPFFDRALQTFVVLRTPYDLLQLCVRQHTYAVLYYICVGRNFGVTIPHIWNLINCKKVYTRFSAILCNDIVTSLDLKKKTTNTIVGEGTVFSEGQIGTIFISIYWIIYIVSQIFVFICKGSQS